MTFREATRKQYLRNSYYTVHLVGPNGQRETIGQTARKTGTGLMLILTTEANLNRLRSLAGDLSKVSFKKRSDRVELSNGWRVEFGGTIRQEAS